MRNKQLIFLLEKESYQGLHEMNVLHIIIRKPLLVSSQSDAKAKVLLTLVHPDPTLGSFLGYHLTTKSCNYSKTGLKQPIQKKTKNIVFKTYYRLMQVKSIAECSLRKLPFAFKTIVLSFFEWPLYTGLHRFYCRMWL